MIRSFTDSVLGGVCGGLAARLGINAWWLRVGFVALALLTQGAFAVFYLILWWTTPQELPTERRTGGAGRLLLALLLAIAIVAGWVGRSQGWLEGPSGQDVFWPGLLLVTTFVFFLRQVRTA